LEATTGFEPVITVLQTASEGLDLGRKVRFEFNSREFFSNYWPGVGLFVVNVGQKVGQ
jgi:hypothetical protein